MKVKQLIRELKKMPQNMEVGMNHHDNLDGEVAGWVFSVGEVEEISVDNGKPTGRTIVMLRT